jgi:hypothetical protein
MKVSEEIRKIGPSQEVQDCPNCGFKEGFTAFLRLKEAMRSMFARTNCDGGRRDVVDMRAML